MSTLAEQGEVLQTLFDAFKVLTEENAKKDAKIEKLENAIDSLKEYISINILQSVTQVRQKITKFDKLNDMQSDIIALKKGLADAKFYTEFTGSWAKKTAAIGFRNLPPLSSLDKIQSSVTSLVEGIEFMHNQRNSDVDDINHSLERLDMRIKQMAEAMAGNGSSSTPSRSIESKLQILTEETIPTLEAEWAARWTSVASMMDKLTNETDKHRMEYNQFVEKHSLKETKLYQIINQSDEARKESNRANAVVNEFQGRLTKIESDVSFALDEIQRYVREPAGVGSNSALFESKLDLARAENKSNWERVNRQTKQDIDGLRIKIERLALLRDEFERLNSDVKSLHDLMVIGGQSVAAPAPPPLVQIIPNKHVQNDSSLLSLIDEGIGTNPGIIHRISPNPTPGDNSAFGTLRVDAFTNRIIWRIEHVDSILREPTRFPKFMLSPEFTSYSESKPLDVLIGRMKLFPNGSDQSRMDGFSSFYLRCLPGVVVRFAVDVCGEVIENFECEYEKQRDKGKHDLVRLMDYIQSDGSVTFGLEIRSIRPIINN